jgi:predicted amidohydrolase
MGLHPTPDLIVLPELWSTGYALNELHTLASDQGDEEATFLGDLAQLHNVWFAGGSIAAKSEEGIFNRGQIINRSGDLTGSYDKVHLVPMLDEDKYLKAGNSHCVYEIEGVSFGFAICYDIRFCEFLRKLALCGAQALIVSAEWPLIRLSHWQALLKARAIENQYFVLAANNVALGETQFAGHSVAHGPDGSTLAQFEFSEDVKVVNINVETVNTIRASVPVFKDRRPELY